MEEQRKPKSGDGCTPHIHFTKALADSFVPNFTQKVPLLPLSFFYKLLSPSRWKLDCATPMLEAFC